MSGSVFGFLDGHRKLLNGDLDRALADFIDDLFLSLEVLPRRPEAKSYYRQTKITTVQLRNYIRLLLYGEKLSQL